MCHGATSVCLGRSGGIQGGLSNGEPIIVRVAFKPTSTIAKRQNTVSREGADTELLAKGRHDPCVVPRAVPMVEAMVALVLADQLLQVRPGCPCSTWCTTSKYLGKVILQHCFEPLSMACTHGNYLICLAVECLILPSLPLLAGGEDQLFAASRLG